MTKDEYQTQRNNLRKEYQQKCKDLDELYAFSDNKVKCGDIITDGLDIIRADFLQVALLGDGFPCLLFSGPWLKKDLTPRKNGKVGYVYLRKDTKIYRDGEFVLLSSLGGGDGDGE